MPDLRRPKSPGESVFGLLMFLVSLVLFWQSYEISGFEALSSPGAFPMAASAMMAIASLIVVIGDLRKPSLVPGPMGDKARAFMDKITPAVVIVFAGFVLGYAALLDTFGFLPTSFLFRPLQFRRHARLADRDLRGVPADLHRGPARRRRARAGDHGLDRGPPHRRGGEVMADALQYFAIAWLDPQLLLLIALGTFAGIYIGAIPGLSVTMAVSILISFTFAWEVNDALCLMVGIYMGGVYGGSRTAILLNIPGAPSAIATALDGYPLAK
jgi:hypothetical protein